MLSLQGPTDTEVAEFVTTVQPREAMRTTIDCLFPEILIIIFRAFVYAEIPFSQRVYNAKEQFCHRAPVLLSHVCRKWHEVALSTSALWSCIAYSAFTWNEEPVAAFLTRARSHSLDIYYRHFNDLTSCRIITLPFLMRISQDGLHTQWRNLVFHCAGERTWRPLLASLNVALSALAFHGLPQLRSLETTLPDDLYNLLEHPQGFDWHHFQTAGSGQSSTLRRLCIRNIPLYKAPVISLYGLRVLELSAQSRVSMLTLCHLLKRTPRLEDLILTNFTPLFDTHLECGPIPPSASGLSLTPAILLENLATLIWQNGSPVDVHQFLSFLRTPALRVLDISLGYLLPRSENQYSSAWKESEASRTEVTLANVTGMKLEFLSAYGQTRLRPLLANLAFASLNSLELVGASGSVHNPLYLDTTLFGQPLPVMKLLTLRSWDICGSQETRALSNMPALVGLVLHECSGIDLLLGALADCTEPGGVAIKYCPRLEALTLSTCAGLHFWQMALLLMIRNTPDSENEITTGPRTIKPLPKRSLQHPSASTMTQERSAKITRVCLENMEDRGFPLGSTAMRFSLLGVKVLYVDGVPAVMNGRVTEN